jgi:hypothetical protein
MIQDIMCKDDVILMKNSIIIHIWLLISLFCISSCSSSTSGATGTIKGYVLLPREIDIGTVAKEAKAYIYLRDYTPVGGKQVLPWNAPIKKVIKRAIRPLRDHRVSFKFRDLPKGVYGVSVLVDTGRPHISPGSLNFTAFPGDYAGGMKENVTLEGNQTIEVSIRSGMYIALPDGYSAPLYSSD